MIQAFACECGIFIDIGILFGKEKKHQSDVRWIYILLSDFKKYIPVKIP